MPLETDATQSSPQISGMGSLADKLMLVIPTLHPVESLRFHLHHITTSLEKQSLPFDAVVVCDESRDCSRNVIQRVSDIAIGRVYLRGGGIDRWRPLRLLVVSFASRPYLSGTL